MRLAELKNAYSHARYHPVLITEVTRMQGGHFCVAGWDLRQGRMVRPLPQRGKNWKLHLGQKPFLPGQLVNCRIGRAREGEKICPHCLEDFSVAERPWVFRRFDEAILHQLLLETLDGGIGDIFQAELIERRYLIEGTGKRSLGGILVPRHRLFFFHEEERLRLHLIDGRGRRHDLAVTCDRLLHYFSQRGEEWDYHLSEKDANEWLEMNDGNDGIILRIGLSRGWAGPEKEWNPKRCYAQLNGIVCPKDNWQAFERRRKGRNF